MSIEAMKQAHQALLSAANCVEYQEIAEEFKQEAKKLRQAIEQAEKQLAQSIRPKGKSWLTVNADGNIEIREIK
jgi:very-short-patch-repair endonuclease